jgi:hypothetical protein
MRVSAFLLALVLGFAAFSAGAAEPRPLEEAFATFRGTGDQLTVAVSKPDEKGVLRHFGLLRNGENVVFTGPVEQMSEGRHFVHFLRSSGKIYALLGSGILELPVTDLADSHSFEVFELAESNFPEQHRKSAIFWRGVRVPTRDGRTKTIWASSQHEVFVPEEDVPGQWRRDQPTLRYPYVGLEDFLSRFEDRPVAATESSSAYRVFGVTPDPKKELIFDLIEVRSEKGGYQAYSESRSFGRARAARDAVFFRGIPEFFLSAVYHEFDSQPGRPAFDGDLVKRIRAEDAKLGFDRMVYVWSNDEHGRTPGGIRLFQAYPSEMFHSKDIRTPVERKYPALEIRARFGDEALYEFNRLIVRKELAPWLDAKRLVGLMLLYMEARSLPKGRFLIHTDRDGAVLYRRFFGAQVEFGPETTGDGTVILSVRHEDLRKKTEGAALPGLSKSHLRAPRKWCPTLLGPSS